MLIGLLSLYFLFFSGLVAICAHSLRVFEMQLLPRLSFELGAFLSFSFNASYVLCALLNLIHAVPGLVQPRRRKRMPWSGGPLTCTPARRYPFTCDIHREQSDAYCSSSLQDCSAGTYVRECCFVYPGM
jgi:hypothetical protein